MENKNIFFVKVFGWLNSAPREELKSGLQSCFGQKVGEKKCSKNHPSKLLAFN